MEEFRYNEFLELIGNVDNKVDIRRIVVNFPRNSTVTTSFKLIGEYIDE